MAQLTLGLYHIFGGFNRGLSGFEAFEEVLDEVFLLGWRLLSLKSVQLLLVRG